jgi:hypothetical protein
MQDADLDGVGGEAESVFMKLRRIIYFCSSRVKNREEIFLPGR